MTYKRSSFACGRVISPIHGVEIVAVGGFNTGARETYEAFNVFSNTWRVLKTMNFVNHLATGVQFGNTGEYDGHNRPFIIISIITMISYWQKRLRPSC
jgi:hypothetical protein